MSASITVAPGVDLCHLPATWPLSNGGVLVGGVLAYERQGPREAPTIAVLGGISAGAHVSAHAARPERGWWDDLVGPGRAIDTTRFQVLSFDWLGGAGGSSAPAAGESFPFVAAEDQAAALWQLCDSLRIAGLRAIIGSSYGGMVALHAAAAEPARVERLAVIAAAHRSHPQASGWRAVQREIVQLGVQTGRRASALALARQLALLGYRTPDLLHERFAEPATIDGDDVHTPVQDWLAARGEHFAARWTAEQFLCLNRSIDAHAIDPCTVSVPTSLLAFPGDQLVPPACVRELALALPDLRVHRELRSRFGHDAFLKEPALVGAFVREVLS